MEKMKRIMCLNKLDTIVMHLYPFIYSFYLFSYLFYIDLFLFFFLVTAVVLPGTFHREDNTLGNSFTTFERERIFSLVHQ